MTVEFELHITEETNLDDTIGQLAESFSSKGFTPEQIEAALYEVKSVVQGYDNRGRELVRNGSNMSLKHIVEHEALRVKIFCDYRATGRPLWERLWKRITT